MSFQGDSSTSSKIPRRPTRLLQKHASAMPRLESSTSPVPSFSPPVAEARPLSVPSPFMALKPAMNSDDMEICEETVKFKPVNLVPARPLRKFSEIKDKKSTNIPSRWTKREPLEAKKPPMLLPSKLSSLSEKSIESDQEIKSPSSTSRLQAPVSRKHQMLRSPLSDDDDEMSIDQPARILTRTTSSFTLSVSNLNLGTSVRPNKIRRTVSDISMVRRISKDFEFVPKVKPDMSNLPKPNFLRSNKVKTEDKFLLPYVETGKDAIKRIDADTLDRLLRGVYSDKIDKYHIIDCRFPYEYEGGHIATSQNVNTVQHLTDLFLNPATKSEKTAIIFTCEFSSQRGPRMALYLRDQDRKLNYHSYPELYYPDVYILKGGYREFYAKYKSHCIPQKYIEMSHDDYRTELKRGMSVYKREFSRTKCSDMIPKDPHFEKFYSSHSRIRNQNSSRSLQPSNSTSESRAESTTSTDEIKKPSHRHHRKNTQKSDADTSRSGKSTPNTPRRRRSKSNHRQEPSENQIIINDQEKITGDKNDPKQKRSKSKKRRERRENSLSRSVDTQSRNGNDGEEIEQSNSTETLPQPKSPHSTRKKSKSRKGSSSHSRSSSTHKHKHHNHRRRREKSVMKNSLNDSIENYDTTRNENNEDKRGGGIKSEPKSETDVFEGKEDYIFEVVVEKCENLELDVNVLRPVVRVHIVDAQTGTYVKKSTMKRKSISAYEQVDYILPILSKPFSLQKNQTLSPQWQESLLINENYSFVMRQDIVMFFEVLDFAGQRQRDNENSDGWYPIAWAFLKPMGYTNSPNLEKEVQLQLYKYKTPFIEKIFPFRNDPLLNLQQHQISKLFGVWKQLGVLKLKKYPSTLFVTVRGHPPLEKRTITTRSMYPTDIETGKLTFEQLLSENLSKNKVLDQLFNTTANEKHRWRRLMGQNCLLPTTISSKIETGELGSYTLSFSHSGYYLAIACVSTYTYPIKICSVLTSTRVAVLSGHQDLVYDIQWSLDDRYLATASSDGSVRIWGFNGDEKVGMVGMLQHPTFVYTCAFLPSSDTSISRVLVTGGYDSLLRLWTLDPQTRPSRENVRPYQVLTGHASGINCLVVNKPGTVLYFADQTGIINIWASSKPTSPVIEESQISGPGEPRFSLVRSVDIVNGAGIQYLSLHPSDRRLLVTTKTGQISAIDLRIYRVIVNYQTPETRDHRDVTKELDNLGSLKKYGKLASDTKGFHGTADLDVAVRGKYTPCGSMVVAGRQSGILVWKAESGTVSKVYRTGKKKGDTGMLGVEGAVVAVEYHPLEHLVGLAVLGPGQPPHGHCAPSVLVCGPRQSGKSHLVTALVKVLPRSSLSAYINASQYTSPRALFEAIIDNFTGTDPHKNGYKTYTRIDTMADFLKCLIDIISVDEEWSRYIIIDNAEKLRQTPDLISQFLRLQQTTNRKICVILISTHGPEDFSTFAFGLSLPTLTVPPLTKHESLLIISQDCPPTHSPDLYKSFASLLYDFFRAPSQYLDELRYHTKTLFPLYIQPIENGEVKEEQVGRLAKHMEKILRPAMDKMYLRDVTLKEFSNFSGRSDSTQIQQTVRYDLELPFFTKYLLIAAYLASYNPQKLDSRYFSRVGDGKKRYAKDKVLKKKQHLLGPKPFPVERMLAIFYSIIDKSMEHTIDIQSQIASLISLKLLHRISKSDQLEGIRCKCNVSYGLVKEIADGIKFDLRNYLHEY
ncbi:Jouberin [Nowakowskiella sp. JEL0407]|nr:Jouberin [Nowakowskiella sp. JEL0407]